MVTRRFLSQAKRNIEEFFFVISRSVILLAESTELLRGGNTPTKIGFIRPTYVALGEAFA
jgi:hypothetical protein